MSRMCRSLGTDSEPEPPYQFAIGELGCLVLEDDCSAARLILNAQSGPQDMAFQTAEEQLPAGPPVYLTKSPGGRMCYHLVTDAQSDQTKQLLDALNALISGLASRDG